MKRTFFNPTDVHPYFKLMMEEAFDQGRRQLVGMLREEPETREEFLARVRKESLLVLLQAVDNKLSLALDLAHEREAKARRRRTVLFEELHTHDQGTITLRSEAPNRTDEQKAARHRERQALFQKAEAETQLIGQHSEITKTLQNLRKQIDYVRSKSQSLDLMDSPDIETT